MSDLKDKLLSSANHAQLPGAAEAQTRRGTLKREIQRVALRPAEFGEAVGLCRASVYKLMSAGRIKSVKNNVGKHGARLITTTPAEYLASLGQEAELS